MDIYWKAYEDVHRERFQRKLYRIRLCLGLSSKEFGNLVGVSRQQVNNVESGRTKLRKPLYLAMMVALLEYVETHKREDIRDILEHEVFSEDKNYIFMLDEVTKVVHIFKGLHHYVAMSDGNATWLSRVAMLSDCDEE